MTDAELEKLLKAAPVPERTLEFWERLPQRISAKAHWQERQSGKVNLPSRPRGGVVWGWVAGAAVLLLVGFLLGNWHGNKQVATLLQNEKLLREVLATFPNQVQAIIQDENGLHLSLAAEPNVPQSQPLWLKICDAGRCHSIVTFSGQTVEVAGQNLEVLATTGGGVMLVGEHFFWSSDQKSSSRDLRIKAQQLTGLL